MNKFFLKMFFLFFSSTVLAGDIVVIFDFGEVLATANKKPMEEFLKKSFSLSEEGYLSLRKIFRNETLIGKTFEKDFWQKLASEKNIVLTDEWFEEYEKSQRDNFFEIPHMIPLVKSLKQQNYYLVLFSNMRPQLAKIIHSLGCYYQHFDRVILSCDIGYEKPDREAFLKLLEILKKDPKDCIFIDDQEKNISIANDLGIEGIQFLSYEKLIKQLEMRNIFINNKKT